MSERALEVGAVALMLGAVASRNLIFVAFGLSLIALGVASLALIRVADLAKRQHPVVRQQATELGDLVGRAARVDRRLGDRDEK